MTQPDAGGAAYALVLAAGQGRRFGGDKLLATLGGRPLVSHAAATVAEAIAAGLLAGGVAVLPVGATALAWSLDTAGLTLVENPDAAEGMSTSLRRGLAALAAPGVTPPAGAALVVLADQPHLRLEVLRALVDDWRRRGGSVRPRYRDDPETPGHPVLLDRAVWSLADLFTGDAGLGPALARRAEPVRLLDLPGGNPDVDTPDDLSRLEDSR